MIFKSLPGEPSERSGIAQIRVIWRARQDATKQLSESDEGKATSTLFKSLRPQSIILFLLAARIVLWPFELRSLATVAPIPLLASVITTTFGSIASPYFGMRTLASMAFQPGSFLYLSYQG